MSQFESYLMRIAQQLVDETLNGLFSETQREPTMISTPRLSYICTQASADLITRIGFDESLKDSEVGLELRLLHWKLQSIFHFGDVTRNYQQLNYEQFLQLGEHDVFG